MAKYKILLIALLCATLCGCASLIARPPQVILLPEERIFTVPAGTEINVTLDKKPIKMTFPEDMKLVAPTVLVRQEEKLNNETLNSIKAKADADKKVGIIGSICAIFAACAGIFFKMKSWLPKIKANVEVK